MITSRPSSSRYFWKETQVLNVLELVYWRKRKYDCENKQLVSTETFHRTEITTLRTINSVECLCNIFRF